MELTKVNYTVRVIRALHTRKLRGYLVSLDSGSSVYVWKGTGYYFFTDRKGRNKNYRLLRDAIFHVLRTR